MMLVENRDKPGIALDSLVLTGLFFAASVAGLLLLPVATQSGPASAGWWTQPWLMPSIFLAIMAIANGLSLLKACRDYYAVPRHRDDTRAAVLAILGWFRPLEFYVYFLAYIFVLGRIGYFLSTLVFLLGLCLRTGLTSVRWLTRALLAAVALTAIFRWGLGVWFPPADLYELLPDGLRKVMTARF